MLATPKLQTTEWTEWTDFLWMHKECKVLHFCVSPSVQIWLCGSERWSGWERAAGREVLWEDRSLSCGLLWEPALHQVCVWLRDPRRWLLHPLWDFQNRWVEHKKKGPTVAYQSDFRAKSIILYTYKVGIYCGRPQQPYKDRYKQERALSVFSLSVPVGELPEEKRSVDNADM